MVQMWCIVKFFRNIYLKEIFLNKDERCIFQAQTKKKKPNRGVFSKE